MEWTRVIKHFGEVQEGETLKAEFTYQGPKEISKIRRSCNCFSAVLVGKTVTVTMKAGKKKSGRDYLEESGFVIVTFQDGSTQQLTVKALVV